MRRLLILVIVILVALSTSAQWVTPQPQGEIPAYNAAPPRKDAKLKPILPKERRIGPYFQHPAQVRSYEMAEEIHEILYQLPCYCYCDRGHGHNSLRTCFEDEHGAACDACMKEAVYAYREHKAGKKAPQIRQGIIKGEWKSVDLQSLARARR
jgi:hypothetical protein